MSSIGDNYEYKELNRMEYDLLYDSIKSLSGDIKEIHIAFEQSRRDIAAGFVPRDILDLRVVNMQNQMTALEQKLSDLRDNLRENEQKSIGNVERIWLRIGTIGGVIGVFVAILEYFQRIHP